MDDIDSFSNNSEDSSNESGEADDEANADIPDEEDYTIG